MDSSTVCDYRMVKYMKELQKKKKLKTQLEILPRRNRHRQNSKNEPRRKYCGSGFHTNQTHTPSDRNGSQRRRKGA